MMTSPKDDNFGLKMKVCCHFTDHVRWEVWRGDERITYGLEPTIKQADVAGKIWLHLIKRKLEKESK